MWKIVVLSKDGRDMTTFRDEKEALKFMTKIKKEFKNDKGVEIYKISARDHIPLNPNKPKPHNKTKAPMYWCPFCGDWRTYHPDRNGNLACRVCTITTNEYYVKKINHLWK